MDDVSAKSSLATHVNKLPAEIVGRFLQKLSVGDRLKSERVSPFWKQSLSKWGWIEQRKLDRDIVFEGANNRHIHRFWENYNGSSYLVLLFKRVGPWLRELDLSFFSRDLYSIYGESKEQIIQKIAGSFELLIRLEKLNIYGLDLAHFVNYLPNTLRELITASTATEATMEALSDRCPYLEEVPFQYLDDDTNFENVIELIIRKFPRLKRLHLNPRRHYHLKKKGVFAPIGQLKELEQLWTCSLLFLDNYALDSASLEAIVKGCQRLRSLQTDLGRLKQEELFHLAKMPYLTALEIFDHGKFSDAILKAIAQRGQLKKLRIKANSYFELSITDDSIVYLIDRCKSLVSLDLSCNSQITERSLKAVVAEVRRRHGTPPQALPADPLDNGIFYFRAWGIEDSEKEMYKNPWLKDIFILEIDGLQKEDPRKII